MDTSVLLAVALCLSAIFILQRLTSRRKLPPGPMGVPILGYLPFLTRQPYLDFQKLGKKYGNVFRIRMGSINVIVLNDYDSTKEAFFQDAFIGRPPESPFKLNKETLDSGVFFGPAWKRLRRFSLHALRDLGLGKSKMEVHIQEEIQNLLECLEQNANKSFCICDVLIPSMSNNIASLVFGERLKYDHPARKMMNRTLQETSKAAGQAVWQLFFPNLRKICKFLGIGNMDKVAKIQQELRNYIKNEINEHQKTLNSGNARDFIDCYLLEMEKRQDDPAFCKPVLQDLVGGFFGAGSETVRLSVEWLLLTAAAYEDAQRLVQREIDAVVGQDRFPAWPDHESMPYTEAFIMELNRWRTIIPLNLMRYAIDDAEIGEYFIPKHSYILANLWNIHHDPEYWGADADEFRPERFLTEDGKKIKKWERYIPFSIGKRQCPGEPLAKIEVFLYFTAILQKFNVKLPEGKAADFGGDLGIGLIPKPQELIYTKRT